MCKGGNMFLKKLAITTIAAVASVGAMADWISGAETPSTSGELILTVWNTDLQTSFSQDLGVLAKDAMTGALAFQDFTLDAGGLTHLGAGNIFWNVAGANSLNVDLADIENNGFYLTGEQPWETRTFSQLNSLMVNKMQEYENKLGTADSGSAADPVFFLEGAGYAGAGNVWGNKMNGLTFDMGNTDTQGAAGEILTAWTVGANTSFGPNVKAAFGTWDLDLASGVLSYAAVAEVPIPAAAWLFGSALLGLTGAARRRKAQA